MPDGYFRPSPRTLSFRSESREHPLGCSLVSGPYARRQRRRALRLLPSNGEEGNYGRERKKSAEKNKEERLSATGWGGRGVSAEGGDGSPHILRPARHQHVTAERTQAWRGRKGGRGGGNFDQHFSKCRKDKGFHDSGAAPPVSSRPSPTR